VCLFYDSTLFSFLSNLEILSFSLLAQALDSLVRVSRRVMQMWLITNCSIFFRTISRSHIRKLFRIHPLPFQKTLHSHEFLLQKTISLFKSITNSCNSISTKLFLFKIHFIKTSPPHLLPSLSSISGSHFNSLFKVLFTFPSRYLFAIGFCNYILPLMWTNTNLFQAAIPNNSTHIPRNT
jgi:hypothetical protein